MLDFTSLPDELIIKILYQLDSSDLLNLFRIKALDPIWSNLIVVNDDYNFKEIEDFNLKNIGGKNGFYQHGVDRRLRIPHGVLTTDWCSHKNLKYQFKPLLVLLVVNDLTRIVYWVRTMIYLFTLGQSTLFIIHWNDHTCASKVEEIENDSNDSDYSYQLRHHKTHTLYTDRLFEILKIFQDKLKILSIYAESVFDLRVQSTQFLNLVDRINFPNVDCLSFSQSYWNPEREEECNKLTTPHFITPALKDLYIQDCFRSIDLNNFNPPESIMFSSGTSIKPSNLISNDYLFLKLKKLFLNNVKNAIKKCSFPVLEELHVCSTISNQILTMEDLNAPELITLQIESNYLNLHLHNCEFPKLFNLHIEINGQLCLLDNYIPNVENLTIGGCDETEIESFKIERKAAFTGCILEKYKPRLFQAGNNSPLLADEKYSFPKLRSLNLKSNLCQFRILKQIDLELLNNLKITQVLNQSLSSLNSFKFNGLKSLHIDSILHENGFDATINLNAPNLETLYIQYGERYDILQSGKQVYAMNLFDNITECFPQLKHLYYDGPFLYSKGLINKPIQLFKNFNLLKLESLILDFHTEEIFFAIEGNHRISKVFHIIFENCNLPLIESLMIRAPKNIKLETSLPLEISSPKLENLCLNNAFLDDYIPVTIDSLGKIKYLKNLSIAHIQ
ncbi:hypothetical protein BN7_718 [Wickerhamomyces ciferrii]|uniref:F-box domain-containing protein n=1 Tax=Wickerhamomyces ciferrii (strain ATCC 14091 / BCRC 22168 / CBS 111 / JCM 3599 / NBRC 0793 / NRRL Y-1031 F-60-10) TaxID=1206466 RepID=K0KE33_WICCF|nr:uncharacterized protein BN7_718 [Wickerhamomyces ciferrii]CCH41181.1 hypothetical protein BN7_718 [Wickerhamomyces ciferrii]